jgi:FkbM family methyltransferase
MTCVEPDPYNLPLLHRVLALNRLSDTCPVIEACASNREGVVSFLPGQYSESQVVEDGAAGTLESHSIDVFDLLTDIDLIKMDIEGSEWPILSDPRFSAVDALGLVLEWHQDPQPEVDSEASVLAALMGAGFQIVSRRKGGDFGLVWAVRGQDL